MVIIFVFHFGLLPVPTQRKQDWMIGPSDTTTLVLEHGIDSEIMFTTTDRVTRLLFQLKV
jgi:hypothetical protein